MHPWEEGNTGASKVAILVRARSTLLLNALGKIWNIPPLFNQIFPREKKKKAILTLPGCPMPLSIPLIAVLRFVV